MNLHNHTVEEKPYQVHIFDGLLQCETEVERLREDVGECVKLKSKDNDLYRFSQSKDLRCELNPKKLKPRVLQFIESLANDIRVSLEKQTSIELSEEHIDVTVSQYKQGDYLLCHNDHLKYSSNTQASAHRRALAFVYYLTKRPWQVEKDGGGLALYETDAMGEPVKVSKRIAPLPNRLVVFQTSELSWHAVEEVLCKDDLRLSINGWFHTYCGAENSSKLQPVEECPGTLYRPIPVNNKIEKFFQECVNQEYLSNQTCALIRRRFKKKSEINLVNFLVPQKYKQISEQLREMAKEEQNLNQIGPYNKRHYKVIRLDRLTPLCRDLYEAFRSELFYMQLAKLTGLDLQNPTLIDPSDEVSEEEEEESSDSGDSSDSEDTKESEDASEPAPEAGVVSEAPSDAEVTGTNEDSPIGTVKSEEKETQVAPEEETKKRPVKRRKISDPLARFEFRHFQHGSYTLIHDHSFELAESSALDVMLHFNHDFEVNFQDGGFISYIDGSGEESSDNNDDELLTIEPKSNCLSLVYRADPGTCRFVKHINKTHQGQYQDLSCVFYERSSDLPGGVNICTY